MTRISDEIVLHAWRTLNQRSSGTSLSAVGDALTAVLPAIERPLREEIDAERAKAEAWRAEDYQAIRRLDAELAEKDHEIERLTAEVALLKRSVDEHWTSVCKMAEELLSHEEIEAVLRLMEFGPGVVGDDEALDTACERLVKQLSG